MNQATFEQGMTELAIAFNQDANGPRLSVYYDRLKLHSDAVFLGAVERVLDSERFFPSIATLHGHCDRVAEEIREQERRDADASLTLRIASETALPFCGTCNDLGWVRIEHPMSNQPSRTMKCPYCEQAFKGPDLRRAQRDHDAAMYEVERDRASRPTFAPPVRHSVESSEPPPNDFAMKGVPVPETQSERTKRLIAESAARMKMSNAGKQERYETR